MDFIDVNTQEPSECQNFDSDDEEESERRHFVSVLTAFSKYRNYTLHRVKKTEKFMSTLPPTHQNRMKEYSKYMSKIKWCIDQNHSIIKDIISEAPDIFVNIPSSEMCLPVIDDLTNTPKKIDDPFDSTKTEDIEKVKSILKQIVRDWSDEGNLERQQCYQPIIDEILKEFPLPENVSVLVPGAGLGRLAFEIAVKGYRCQGNEFSLFMLFVGNYILNKCHNTNGFKIYPWVHQFVNNLSCEQQIKEVTFPDTDPSKLIDADFSMIAGDFLKVYDKPDEWNCVATCFFIDCAPNVIAFIETIYKILKPGGIWINLGPLLYHYSDMANEDSIEPPFDILCDIIKDVGFIIEKSEVGIKTKYAQNPNSMLQQEYNSVFFVCRKPDMHLELNEIISMSQEDVNYF